MTDLERELKEIESHTMAQLKDFQCATVERIDELFRTGQKRVLVADEVGLGKTLIARGTIAKTAIMQYMDWDPLFKIVYICSNQVIANQNIQKLDVFNIRPDEKTDDTRLSMQHLRIAEQEYNAKQEGHFAQLIPLTPTTSFSMTNGGGTKEERALMFSILRRLPELNGYIDYLDEFISLNVNNWEWLVDYYCEKIQTLSQSKTGYPDNVIKKVLQYDKKNHIIEALINHINELRRGIHLTESDNSILRKLRRMFAEISVGMLKPDLVIMDEFQRFRFLIDPGDDETENSVIAKRFFATKDLKVLLLSATPYKLYSTIDEIEEAGSPEEYYKEFFQVMEFLVGDKLKMEHFYEVWSDYSFALRELIQGDTAVLALKQRAEDEMYRYMCRTERISVMDSGDYIDDSSVHSALAITEGDIHTYLDMGRMLKSIGDDRSLLVDFAKSTPYLMSYMNHYKVKERTETFFKKNVDELSLAKGKYLWIDRNRLEHYDEIPSNNARLDELKRQVFRNNSELYMWVPPSKPYYGLEGIYKESSGFSKLLVFSSWEMVPKMIGSMISYEAERRTVGVLSNNKGVNSTYNTYFSTSKQRYPAARLRFNVSKKEPQGMYLFCLLYPSETLAELYHPIEYLNRGCSLGQVKAELKTKIQTLLEPLITEYEHDTVKEDKKWYYMTPLLLDDEAYVDEWISSMKRASVDDDEIVEETGAKGFPAHLQRLRDLMDNIDVELGRAPIDLADVLAEIAIGSFAVCAYRANGGDAQMASELAKVFIDRFNSQEATASVMLAYADDKESGGDGHWRNVLRYCCDGGFGAMLDEYVHMVSEGTGFGLSDDRNRQIHETMKDSLKIRAVNYVIDTYPAFKKRMRGDKYQRTSMRSHYAVGFINGESSESKSVVRKDSIRNAFNSPLRPFVLATTSIGQEGLDFHPYCRKIMHWNLPGNPIDLEQREGRINRFKCLAIRQDIATRFSDKLFNSDVWQELFAFASEELRQEGQSDLVPYWCLGERQEVKIERIIPMYPISKDEINYQRLVKVLSLYRLTMGQARQEELVNYILENGVKDRKYINKLFINLSPYIRKDTSWKKKMISRAPVIIEKKKSERQGRIESLQKRLQKIESEMQELILERNQLKVYEIIGMIVDHKLFGEGIVSECDNEHITVDFDNDVKSFKMPGAFIDGYLFSEYTDYLEDAKKQKDIDDSIGKLKKEEEEIRCLLQELVI